MESPDSSWKSFILGALFLLALAVSFFWPYLFDDALFFPAHTGTMLPWRDEIDSKILDEMDSSANMLAADKIHMFHPELTINKRSIQRGEAPLWDPYSLGGIPHLAQGMPGLFHILNYSYFFMEIEKSYAIISLIQIFAGALFMLMFLRALGLHIFAATIGGMVFGFSGWMLLHLHYFMISGAAMWLPLLLLSAERLIKGGRPWWIFAMAIGVFQTLCAGFAQIAVINIYLTVIYCIVRSSPALFKTFKLGFLRLNLAGIGVFLGILLSGIQLVPSAYIAYSDEAIRSVNTRELVYEKRLDPECLATFAAPDIFGNPDLSRETDSPHIKDSSLLSMALLPPFRSDINYVEINGYIGVLPLLLAMLLLFCRPRKGWFFFAAAFVFSLLIALGIPVILDIISLMPGMLIGDAKRFLFFTAFCLIVMSAFSLDGILRSRGAPLTRKIAIAAALIIVIASGAGWIYLKNSSEETLKQKTVSAIHENTGWNEVVINSEISKDDFNTQKDHVSKTLLKTMLHFTLAGIAIFLLTLKGVTRLSAYFMVVAVIVFDLFSLGLCFNRPTKNLPLYDESNPVVSFLKKNAGDSRIFRFKDDLIYPVCSCAVHEIYDAQGYTAFYFKRYRHLIDILEEGISREYGTLCPKKMESLSSPVLDMLSVKYILSKEKIEAPDISEAFKRKKVSVYENKGCMPRAFIQMKAFHVDTPETAANAIKAEGYEPISELIIEKAPTQAWEIDAKPGIRPLRITKITNNEVNIKAAGGPGWLVLNDTFCDGWICEIDGKSTPIYAANLAFRAALIPDSASHDVCFRYQPKSVLYGEILSFSGLAICLLLAFMMIRNSVRS